MIHSGFKRNEKIECLNKWFKFGFFGKYGNMFNSYQEFEYKF
ncbi:hypothetical protein P344_02315 [Spiroplasma mirum ATCC 29335]|uniref:Uncharacterized protein n=1 Tax=Spiroplasma mirum ATCC 29335 TaxID=838561 RepID=W6AM68_9MOLU|nr:hypothetical protein P344_02315 [Spiroplasma mirum ATCC 29335]